MDLTSLRFHHGGTIVNRGNMKEYVGGTVTELLKFNLDYITGSGIIDFVTKTLGSQSVKNFYYLIPGQNLAEGLRAVGYDKEVIDMCDHAKKNPFVDIYSDHEIIDIDDNADGDEEQGFDGTLRDVNIEANSNYEGVEEVFIKVAYTDEEDANYEGGEEGHIESDSSSVFDWFIESDDELIVARQNVKVAKEREYAEKHRGKEEKMWK